jgi:hypothetical protein
MPDDALLTRAQFETKVFARSKGRCVFCAKYAVDPHHIFDRKLYPDGGYYLRNGAAVCEAHHWGCETTRVSVLEVLAAAKIAAPVYLQGFDPSLSYDKWGNRIRPDGLREAGPLFDDTGCRKALTTGGFLGLFVPAGTPLVEN